jgi:hypothetical protein
MLRSHPVGILDRIALPDVTLAVDPNHLLLDETSRFAGIQRPHVVLRGLVITETIEVQNGENLLM